MCGAIYFWAGVLTMFIASRDARNAGLTGMTRLTVVVLCAVAWPIALLAHSLDYGR